MKKGLSIFLIVSLMATQPGLAQFRPEGTTGRERDRREQNTSNDIRSFRMPSPQVDHDEQEVDDLTGRDSAAGLGAIHYNVHILGEVKQPGTYRLLPSDRLSDSLKFAGGITDGGSTRAIQLRRHGSNQIIDLFSYKYGGNLSQNPYLTENDVVFVPLKKGEFSIEGPVGRPGQYEIGRPISLARAITLAGGFTVGRSLKEPIRVVRFDDSGKKQISDIDGSEEEALERFLIRKGDIIVVPHVLIANKKFDYSVERLPGDNLFYPTISDNVYVVGAVAMPGSYPFQPSFSVSNYISQAGPQDNASIGRAKIISVDGKKRTAKKTDQVNAGDTIVVPGKAITASNFILWFGTLTSMALTTFIFIDRFNQ